MPRKVKVLTTCQIGRAGRTIQESVERMAKLLELGWAEEPDIVCLPETFPTAGTALSRAEKSEPVPGPTTDFFAKLAREHRAIIICPLATEQDGRYYNSAVILDRNGDVAGIYNKVQPVTSACDFSEVESGVTPGTDAPVFELDCGRIGIQTCFDIEFPETWAQLEERGAEIVFWDSAYDGGFALRAYACLHGYYVVSSVRTRHARIINPLGEVLDHTGQRMPIASRTIDLDYMICHHDFHHGIVEEMVRVFGDKVTVRMQDEEGHFLVESNSDDMPMDKLAEVFGLVSRREYAELHRRVYPALRRGEAPEAQRPRFAGRQPYVAMGLAEWEQIRDGAPAQDAGS